MKRGAAVLGSTPTSAAERKKQGMVKYGSLLDGCVMLGLAGAAVYVGRQPSTRRINRILQYLLITLSFATVVFKASFLITKNDRISWAMDFISVAATWLVVFTLISREERQDQAATVSSVSTKPSDPPRCPLACPIEMAKQEVLDQIQRSRRGQQSRWLFELGEEFTVATRGSYPVEQEPGNIMRLVAINEMQHQIYDEIRHLGTGGERELKSVLDALHSQATLYGVEGDFGLALQTFGKRIKRIEECACYFGPLSSSQSPQCCPRHAR